MRLSMLASPFALALLLAPARSPAQSSAPPASKPVAAARVAPSATARVEYVKVGGADYAFTAPDRVSAGIVAFNLQNEGADLHALAVFELPDNHTLAQFLDMYHSKGMIPPWMNALGQTLPIASKQEAFLTVRLKPGRYILACLIPARDGRAHTEKGMVKLVTAR